MILSRKISGFSRLSRKEKAEYIKSIVIDQTGFESDIESHLHRNIEYQELYSDFSENVITNYFLPYSVSPNFLINNKTYVVPMVTDESSVVAASSSAAKFWSDHGGFHAKVLSTIKNGQVHFLWKGTHEELSNFFLLVKDEILDSLIDLTYKMEGRGGGITSLDLIDKTSEMPGYYQLNVKFETCESMGANFINSVLERVAVTFSYLVTKRIKGQIEIIMSILSNYSPECVVESYVECPVEKLESGTAEFDAGQFARRFKLAVDIAGIDIYRAVTHNKGIYNGIDAVTIATGNDFRAVEAQGHAYASRSGTYRPLSGVTLDNGIFRFSVRVPLTIGTTGGLTRLHPMAARSFELLGNPSSKELMEIIASAGLAANFSAVRSLVTKGIQKGHMKMHLSNILKTLHATPLESKILHSHFRDKTIDHHSVSAFLKNIRNESNT